MSGAGLRDPTDAEHRELSRLLVGWSFDPDALLRWFQAHPDVRADSFSHGRTVYMWTPIGISFAYSDRSSDPLIQELLSRNPDFTKKDDMGMTLLEFMDDHIQSLEDALARGNAIYITPDSVALRKTIREMFRTKMMEQSAAKKDLPALAGLSQLARQKNLPGEVEELIGSQVSGVPGPIRTQQNTLRTRVGLPPKSGGRRRRKTRRTRRR